MITLRQGDMRQLIRTLPDGSVDAIVSDIPYPVISGGNKTKHDRCSGMLSANNGRIFDHNDIAVSEYAGELFRVLPDQGHVWMFTNELNRRKVEDAMLAAGFKTHFLAAWIKNNCTPNRWGMKNGELYFLFRKGAARTLYDTALKQFIHVSNISGDKSHPTEKPVGLVAQMVVASAKEGQTVLDPFMGTGAVGVACQKYGRRFIGFEIDAKYYAKACLRMGRMPG